MSNSERPEALKELFKGSTISGLPDPCTLVRTSAIRWVAGTLDADVARLIKKHLRGCSGCREHVDGIVSVSKDRGKIV